MNKKRIYDWLVRIVGCSYEVMLEQLDNQLEKENKQNDTTNISNTNPPSDKDAKDVLYGVLLDYRSGFYTREHGYYDTAPTSLGNSDSCKNVSVLSNVEDGNALYSPKSSHSRYYVLLYVVTLLYEFCLSDSKKFSDFVSLKNISDETIKLIGFISSIFSDSTSISFKSRRIDFMIMEMSRNCLNDNNPQLYMKEEWTLRYRLCVFLLKVVNSKFKIEYSCRQASARIAFECMKELFRRKEYKYTIKFASLALMDSRRVNCLVAFNYAGISALYNKQYQAAYDIYMSWINKSMLDSIKQFCGLDEKDTKCINTSLQSDEEDNWRKQSSYYVSVMYGNMSFVCTEIFDYLGPTERGYVFLQVARYYNDLDLAKSKRPSAHLDSGRIFVFANKYDEAINCFETCYKSDELSTQYESNITLKTAALRRLILYYPNISTKKSDKWFDGVCDSFIRNYDLLSNTIKSSSNEVFYGRNLYFLLSSCRKLSFRRKRQATYILLNIYNDAREILQSLRRRSTPFKEIDYRRECYPKEINNLFEVDKSSVHLISESDDNNKREIAYYTSLENIKYLLDKDSENDSGNITEKNEPNRLTMMHARYMNDPDEGLILLEKNKELLYVSPEELRDNLYDQKYIFLKSFTGLVDQLNMWTLYGSNRETGKDCNGCCVCFEPESFIYIPENDYSDDKKTGPDKNINRHINDDYDLYNVAYTDGKELIVDGKEAPINLTNRYEDLKVQLSDLHLLIKNASDDDKAIISNCLVRLLEKPMFLFKDKSYCLEKESRIIISRDFNDRIEIKKTSEGKDPRKIFINPPLQMFPEKIILGPKVENDDYWMPYLQYKLSEIKDKWEYEKDYNPKVRKSKINIR